MMNCKRICILLVVGALLMGGSAFAQWDLELNAAKTPAPTAKVTVKPTSRSTPKPTLSVATEKPTIKLSTPKPTSKPSPKTTPAPPKIESMRGKLSASCSSWLSSNKYNVDASCAVDGDLSTGWNEGEDGYGVGEWLLLSVPGGPYLVEGINIVNGYTKAKDVWQNNSRVKQLEIYVDSVSIGSFTLQDTMNWQTIFFDKPQLGSDFMFEINSVYPGKKYKDTCIAEIELWADRAKVRDGQETPNTGKASSSTKSSSPSSSSNASSKAASSSANAGVSKYTKASQVPANGYFCPDSASKLLSPSDLAKTSKDVLGYVRNEILARHGYVFNTEKYKKYFNSKTWYKPNSSFDYSDLNKTENDNIERIKKAEG